MKKVIMFVSLILVALIGFKINTNAYSPIGSQEVQAYSNNTSIAYAENPLTNWYRFTITYVQPYSARYVLFSSTTSTSIIFTRSTDLSLTNVMYNEHAQMNKEWYFYLGTVTTYYAWVYNPISGDSAQSALQSKIDSELYYYYDLTNTVQNDVIDSFTQRYLTLDNTEAYNGGYSEGYIVGYNEGLDNSDQYENGYDDGYQAGYNDGTAIDTDVRPLFQTLISFIGSVFMLTIFPGVTIGVLVSIPISFALFKWFMKMFGGK